MNLALKRSDTSSLPSHHPCTVQVSKPAAGRIELTAVSGLRFFATFLLVCGRAIENLWIDEVS
jgi:hypothetical protein